MRMEPMVVRPGGLEDVPSMARLREASGWTGGADESTMRRYLAGEHHPQQATAPRAVFLAEALGELVGLIAGHLTTRADGCTPPMLAALAFGAEPLQLGFRRG
jgi:hypothetical protein